MSISRAEVVDYLANMTVLELSTLIKELEEKFGVSAAAPVAMMAAGPMAGGGGSGGGRADRIRRDPDGLRPQQDPGDQGSPGRHQPGSERGQGSGGECAHHPERSGYQSGSRRSQEEGGSSGSNRRNQVGPAGSIWGRVLRAKRLKGQKAKRFGYFFLFSPLPSCLSPLHRQRMGFIRCNLSSPQDSGHTFKEYSWPTHYRL